MKYYRINAYVPIQKFENYLKGQVANRHNYPVIFNFTNTVGLTVDQIYWINRNFPGVQIRIAGGYTDEKISHDKREYLKYDNIYTTSEMVRILNEINKIESGLQSNWNDEQKLFYFIGYLKNKIIYHPDFEKQPSKDIRSLTGLFSHKTVCAGYALILKELCDRHNIICDYVTGYTGRDKKGNLTGPHAWNLVHLNGRTIPLDLTWNAGRNHQGQFLNITDMGNVNEFIKSHIPDKCEPIQDYGSTLKSLDGNHLRGIYNIVNKTMVYDTTQLILTRSDGTRFSISLVNQTIDQNKSIYTYVYNGISNDGTYARPLIIRSTTNILGIHHNVIQRRKALDKINDLKHKAIKTPEEQEELNKLLEYYNKTYYFNKFEKYITDLLFSKKNILEASVKRSGYIGGIEPIRDEKDKIVDIYGVVVDPKLGKELKPMKTNLCRRSNGTTFILEELPRFNYSDRPQVYRYRMYENVRGDNGTMVVKKNTIMTDQDLLLDTRQGLYDDFLARDRIDRKERETCGYLGYYSNEGIRTYISEKNDYFTRGIWQDYRLNDTSFRNYYADLTFKDMIRLAKTFTFNGKNVINRKTGQVVNDRVIAIQAKFAYVWLNAARNHYSTNEEIPGLNDAFGTGPENIFKYVCSKIQTSINNYGYIDSVDILIHVTDDEDAQYKYAEEIIINLFSTPWYAKAVDDLFRLQNPGAMRESKPIETFGVGMDGYSLALKKISDRAMERAAREKQKIDVEMDNNGNVVMRGR